MANEQEYEAFRMAQISLSTNQWNSEGNKGNRLAIGEFGYNTDTHELKIGDGSTRFEQLPTLAKPNSYEELQGAIQSINNLLTSLKDLSNKIDGIKLSIGANNDGKDSNTIKGDINGIKSDIVNIQTNISTVETDIKAIQDIIGDEESEEGTLISQISDIKTDIEEINNIIGVGEEGGETLTAKISQLEASVGELKFKAVNALPANRDDNTIYFIYGDET